MKIPPELARFMDGPILMSLATRDAGNRPLIARGSGARTTPGLDRVEVAISARIWPDAIANLRDNGMLALTLVQPADYRAFQLKGRARLRPADADDDARAGAYVTETIRVLVGLGVPEALTRYWLTAHDIHIASLAVDRIFEQTPGPRAGAVVA